VTPKTNLGVIASAALKYKEAITIDTESNSPVYLRDGLINLGAVLIMWRRLLLGRPDKRHEESAESPFFELSKFFIDSLRGREKEDFDMDAALSVLMMLTNCIESAVSGDAINLLKRINSSPASSAGPFPLPSCLCFDL
jgi:hypothetical protein